MRIETEVKLDFQDVLIRPKRSTLKSRSEVSLEREFSFLHTENKFHGIPILASNMDTTGTISMAREFIKHNCSVVFHKFIPDDDLLSFFEDKDLLEKYGEKRIYNNWISSGITYEDMKRLERLDKMFYFTNICLDVANGYQEHFLDSVKRIKDMFPEKTIMAGNVVTGDMTEALILAGASVVKVGIGNGSACSTRMKTGVGYPQLSAIIECADAAHGLNGLVCSDGGIIDIGDFAKAFGCGSDFVMAGGIFAGHEESGGDLVEKDGKKYKIFYGMSSHLAQERNYGHIKDYRASEGLVLEIEYKGKVENTLKEILGGIRSTMTYVGARKLKELSKRTTFVKVNRIK